MGAVFDRDQISRARYGRETLPYTWGPASLPVGQTTVFDVAGWNPADGVEKVLILEAVAATQNSGVQLVWSYDGQQSDIAQGWTDALRSGLRPNPVGAWAANRLALTINNQSGSPIANFQLNYWVTVWSIPAAYRLLLGYGLTPSDQRALAQLPQQDGLSPLQQVQSLLQKGTLPISWERQIDSLWRNRRVAPASALVPRHITTPGPTTSASFSVRVPQGYVLVLEALGVEGQPAVQIAVDRDQDQGYVQINGAAVAQANDAPLFAWVPAADHLTFTVSGAQGTFALRPEGGLYRLSDLLALHLSLRSSPAQAAAKVQVGLQ